MYDIACIRVKTSSIVPEHGRFVRIHCLESDPIWHGITTHRGNGDTRIKPGGGSLGVDNGYCVVNRSFHWLVWLETRLVLGPLAPFTLPKSSTKIEITTSHNAPHALGINITYTLMDNNIITGVKRGIGVEIMMVFLQQERPLHTFQTRKEQTNRTFPYHCCFKKRRGRERTSEWQDKKEKRQESFRVWRMRPNSHKSASFLPCL